MSDSYKKVRLQYLLKPENKYCRARIPGVCMGRSVQSIALDIHHMKGRTGELLTNTEFFLPVCRMCHMFITDNPEIARDLGLDKSRIKTEENEEI